MSRNGIVSEKLEERILNLSPVLAESIELISGRNTDLVKSLDGFIVA